MNDRFNLVVGTGGIGTGELFELSENRTLDRNESRMALLSEAKDYCKLHIILYYLARIMSESARIIAIGKTGNDDSGNRIKQEMQDAGIDIEFVKTEQEKSTMHSVCFQYPDKSVCTITASNSACGEVDEKYIMACMQKLRGFVSDRTLVVAVPEVKLAARIELLKIGKEKNAFCVSSFVKSEAREFLELGGLLYSDLLVINIQEAKSLIQSNTGDNKTVAETILTFLKRRKSSTYVALTCAEEGSYCISSKQIEFYPGEKIAVKNTAGAGDAYTAGVIVGLHSGLPLQADKREFFCASELGVAFAEKAVTCIHSIDLSIGKEFADHVLAEKKRRGMYV